MSGNGRCFRAVECLLDDPPALIPVDQQADDQIMHPFSLRKTDRPAYQPLDPRAHIAGFTLDFLSVLFADRMRLGLEMPLLGAPPVGGEAGDAQGLQ